MMIYNKMRFLFINQFVLIIVILLIVEALCSCNTSNTKHEDSMMGTIEILDPLLNNILNKDARIEIIAEGHEWTEGPLWLEHQKMLLYSDIPRNSVYKWTEEKGAELYLEPSGYTGTALRGGETGSNALLLNSKGQLVLCQHGDRRMAIMDAPIDDPKPNFITLASEYNGKKFDSPNDAVYRTNGDLFFTDPPYGLEKHENDPSKAAPYQGVYKLSTDGTVSLLIDSLTRPNGIAFFPGERRMIVANSDPKKAAWYVFDLTEDDSLINGSILYDATPEVNSNKGLPDGLKIDKQGNVFATGPGGVWIFGQTGKLLGKIRFPEATSNCALADDDKTLYVTADMYVLRIKLR